MSIHPSTGIDPKWYDSSLLSKNRPRDISELIARVRRFDRNSVALMASACLWFTWIENKGLSPLNRILASYSLLMTSLALAKCAPEGRPPINEASFRILVGDFFNLFPYLLKDQNSSADEGLKLESALCQQSLLIPILRKINPKTEIPHLKRLLLICRTALIQYDGFTFQMSDLVRQLLIYKKFRSIVLRKQFCNIELLDTAEKIILGTSIDRFVRAIWLIHTFTELGITRDYPYPPPFKPKVEYLNQTAARELDIEDSDLEMVATRLSRPVSDFRKNIENIEVINIHSEALWSLHEYPMLHFDDDNDEIVYLPVSPWRLLRRSITFISQSLIDQIENNLVFENKNRAYQARGEAYELYLQELFSQVNIKKVDQLLPGSYFGPRCDFLWESEDIIILFEVKVKLRPNNDPTFFNPESMVSSWSAAAEAIDQAQKTIRALGIQKKAILLIVTDENLAEQVTQFARAAKQWELLDLSKIQAVAVCPTAHIEHVIRKNKPEEIYNAVNAYSGPWRPLIPAP